jgi:hypothetical protein
MEESITELEVQPGTVKNASDRIYQMLMPDGEPSEDATHPETEATSEVPEEPEQQAEQESEPEAVEEPTEDSEPVTHFNELADHLNVEEDFLLDLEIPTKVNGEERSATIKDLIANYQKGESADVKLMDLAEQRKKIETEQAQVNEKLQQEWGRIQALQSELENLISGDESRDLEVLRHSDPAEYAARVAERQTRLERAEKVRQQMLQEQAARLNDNYTRTVEVEKQKLLQSLPEWGDEKTAQKEMTGVRNYLKEAGFQDWEIDGKIENGVVTHTGLVDHRAVQLARKAWLYDQSKKSSEPKKTRLKSLPKVGSGKRKSKGEVKTEQAEEIRGRVRKSGSMEDAALAIQQMMQRGN